MASEGTQAPSAVPAPPVAFGRYELVERIGEGPIGETWKAKSFGAEGFEKTLVVKRIHPALSAQKRFVELLVEEAKLVLRLSHANVAQVFDLGKVDEAGAPRYFLAMEWVSGLDLGAALARLSRAGTKLPVSIAVYVAGELAKGLHHAHRRRDEQMRALDIVHRDLRPPNVLLSWEGEVKLSDFAITKARGPLVEASDEARAASHHELYAYLSPEAARGEPVDARGDLFALGTILYEMLAGAHPFRADKALETLRRVRSAEHAPLATLRPDLPPALVALVDRALAAAPSARPADAARVYEDLLAFAYASGERAGGHDLAALLAPLRAAEPAMPEPSLIETLADDDVEEAPASLPTIPSSRRSYTPSSAIPVVHLPSIPPPSRGVGVRFVGRHRELARVGELLALATRKKAQSIALLGPPGIGKTRLLREIERRLRASTPGALVAFTECREDERDEPLAAVTALARAVVGSGHRASIVEPRLRALGLDEHEIDAILARIDPKSGRAPSLPAFRSGLVRALTALASDRLVVVGIDDVHLADPESRDVLSSLLARLAGARCAFVLTAESEAPDLPDVVPPVELVLDPLDATDEARLVAGLVGAHVAPEELAVFVRERAAGNPLFAEILIAELVDAGAVTWEAGGAPRVELGGTYALPRELSVLLDGRVARLPAEQREALRAASILGDPVDITTLATTLGQRVQSVSALVDALVDAKLLSFEIGMHVRFPAAVLRQVVREGLVEPLRSRLHAEAAVACETLAVLDEAAARRTAEAVSHWLAAGDAERAASALAACARQRLAARLPLRACADIGRAIELADLGKRAAPELCGWLAVLADASEANGAPASTLGKLRAAVAVVDAAGDVEWRVAARLACARAFGWSGRFGDANELLQGARTLAGGAAADDARVVAIDAELARAQGDFRRALAGYERLAALGKLDDAERRRVALGRAEAHAAAGERDRALAALDELEVDGSGDDLAQAQRARLRATALHAARDHAGALHGAEHALEIARTAGLAAEIAQDLILLGDVLIAESETPRAYARFEQAAVLAEEIGDERVRARARAYLAYLDAKNGAAAAESRLEAAATLAAERGLRGDEVEARWLLAKLALGRTDKPRATKALEACRALAASTGHKLVEDDAARALAGLT